MAYFPTFNKSLIILLIAQAIAGSTVPVLFLISGLIGPQLSPTLALSTLPISLVVVGIACASPLSSWIMSKIGRKYGHILGLFITLIGVSIAGLSLWSSQFWGYCLGNLVAGCGSAFNNQIRFTAAENAGDEKALVHSWVLMFSLFAAFLGPWMTQYGQFLLPAAEYTGSIVLLFTALLILITIMLTFPHKKPETVTAEKTEKIPLSTILSQSRFWLPALCGTASFATMTLLMSATPLQMHTIEHFSKADTTMTIQSHIIAMFFPSLFSGILLAKLGIRKLIGLGSALFLICIGIAYYSSSCHDYWWALVLLGIGWNFLFLAGSAGISMAFTGPERFTAQGLNDTFVYGTQALASLGAGWLLFTIGWSNLVLLPVPFLLGLLFFVWKKHLLNPHTDSQ